MDLWSTIKLCVPVPFVEVRRVKKRRRKRRQKGKTTQSAGVRESVQSLPRPTSPHQFHSPCPNPFLPAQSEALKQTPRRARATFLLSVVTTTSSWARLFEDSLALSPGAATTVITCTSPGANRVTSDENCTSGIGSCWIKIKNFQCDWMHTRLTTNVASSVLGCWITTSMLWKALFTPGIRLCLHIRSSAVVTIVCPYLTEPVRKWTEPDPNPTGIQFYLSESQCCCRLQHVQCKNSGDKLAKWPNPTQAWISFSQFLPDTWTNRSGSGPAGSGQVSTLYSTCISCDHLGSDLTSSLYMQIHMSIIAVYKKQMMLFLPSLSLQMGPLSMCVWVHVAGCVCVCVCVRESVWEGKRERAGAGEAEQINVLDAAVQWNLILIIWDSEENIYQIFRYGSV